jgi:hypothetical protein
MAEQLEVALCRLDALVDRGRISRFEYVRRCDAIQAWLSERGVRFSNVTTLARR